MASKNGRKAEEQPTLDFGAVGREWKLAFRDSVNRATRAQIALQRPLHPEADDDAIQTYYDAQETALNTLQAESDQQAALIAQVLTDVPRNWLVKNAPEQIDWAQVANLDYIRADYYTKLLLFVQAGNTAGSNAKN